MKTLRTFAAFVLVAMSLFAVSAQAGDISVFFGDEMATSKQVKPMQLFQITVVVSDINDNIAGVEYSLNLPANVSIVDSEFYNGTTLVLDGADGTAIALGECVSLVPTPYNEVTEIVVAQYGAIALDTFAETNVTLTEYAGFGSAAPRYANCKDEIHELAPQGGVLTGVTVPATTTSFSKVKALF